jgi:hypothetical protein
LVAYLCIYWKLIGDQRAGTPFIKEMPAPLVRTVPAVRSYRYMVINNQLLLVDPGTGIVEADLTE